MPRPIAPSIRQPFCTLRLMLSPLPHSAFELASVEYDTFCLGRLWILIIEERWGWHHPPFPAYELGRRCFSSLPLPPSLCRPLFMGIFCGDHVICYPVMGLRRMFPACLPALSAPLSPSLYLNRVQEGGGSEFASTLDWILLRRDQSKNPLAPLIKRGKISVSSSLLLSASPLPC